MGLLMKMHMTKGFGTDSWRQRIRSSQNEGLRINHIKSNVAEHVTVRAEMEVKMFEKQVCKWISITFCYNCNDKLFLYIIPIQKATLFHITTDSLWQHCQLVCHVWCFFYCQKIHPLFCHFVQFQNIIRLWTQVVGDVTFISRFYLGLCINFTSRVVPLSHKIFPPWTSIIYKHTCTSLDDGLQIIYKRMFLLKPILINCYWKMIVETMTVIFSMPLLYERNYPFQHFFHFLNSLMCLIQLFSYNVIRLSQHIQCCTAIHKYEIM